MKKISDLHPDIEAVFTAFGRVAYSVQIFEADLISLLIVLSQITQIGCKTKDSPESVLNRESVEKLWREEGVRIQDQLEKLTLGQLLSEFRQTLKKMNKDIIPSETVKEVNEQLDRLPIEDWMDALENRNYLFHRFWYDADNQLTSAKGRLTLLERLANYKDQFDKHVVNVRKALKVIMDIMGYEQH